MSQTNARFQGGGIILPTGSSAGSINVGEKALVVDANGLVAVSDSLGQSLQLGSYEPFHGTDLPDADTTIEPWTDKAGVYVLQAGKLTANRVLTVNNTGGSGPFVVSILVRDISANTYTIKNSAAATLFTKGASPGRAILFALYSGAGGAFATNYFTYVA